MKKNLVKKKGKEWKIKKKREREREKYVVFGGAELRGSWDPQMVVVFVFYFYFLFFSNRDIERLRKGK